MNPTLLKFFKHAGFVLLAALVAALTGLLTGDGAVVSFIAAHPWLALIVPTVSGALGSLAKYLSDADKGL